jgi:asparagine synthase (glutamine-hydrolysing)
MTMAASVECRLPFLDHRLVEGLAGLPSRWLFRGLKGKFLLRETAARRLPPELLRQRKWGFGVPWARYFRERATFRELVGALPTLPPLNAPPFDRRSLRALVDRFLKGAGSDDEVVFHLAMLAIWHSEICQRPWLKSAIPAAPVTGRGG